MTPAVLHVVGAQLVVEALRASLSPPPCEKHRLCTHDGGACEANSAAPTNSSSVECGDEAKAGAWFQAWLMGFGQRAWWSEYTLYRLALDMCARARARACVGESRSSSMARVTRHRAFDLLHALPPQPLICHAVWFAGQRPWDAAAAYSSGCAFSLVQSTSGATPSEVARQIAPHLAACP